MKTIVPGAPYPVGIGEEFKSENDQLIQTADISSKTDIEMAERYFKALREIEFIMLRI
ncbi:MAG TPA: hypothetical protein VNW99_12350 [Cytophagaceae bacterium]|nr:hypothetical protein [Cytophagaceae bacterium]